VAGANSMT